MDPLPAYYYRKGLECLHCETKIFSQSRHDFVTCKCRAPFGISVDGGNEYFKYTFPPKWIVGLDYKIIKKRTAPRWYLNKVKK